MHSSSRKIVFFSTLQRQQEQANEKQSSIMLNREKEKIFKHKILKTTKNRFSHSLFCFSSIKSMVKKEKAKKVIRDQTMLSSSYHQHL